MGKTIAALQYADHKIVVYATERRAPMHRTGTN
jgi:hypothetical protein